MYAGQAKRVSQSVGNPDPAGLSTPLWCGQRGYPARQITTKVRKSFCQIGSMKSRGGTREGAGRPVRPPAPQAKPIAIRLTAAHRARFVELGGVRWLRRMIDESTQK
jgi:hypothetical protein